MPRATDDLKGHECSECGREAIYHPQGAFALAALCRRLLDQGYVVDELQHDLRERAANMERGRGFLLNADLLSRSAPTPSEEEDLLS